MRSDGYAFFQHNCHCVKAHLSNTSKSTICITVYSNVAMVVIYQDNLASN